MKKDLEKLKEAKNIFSQANIIQDRRITNINNLSNEKALMFQAQIEECKNN